MVRPALSSRPKKNRDYQHLVLSMRTWLCPRAGRWSATIGWRILWRITQGMRYTTNQPDHEDVLAIGSAGAGYVAAHEYDGARQPNREK